MSDLLKIVTRLERYYGSQALPPAQGPFELVLWENVCYLLPDERRAQVFQALRKQLGLAPRAILDAPFETLLPLARMGGMRPEVRVQRWYEIAEIAEREFAGDLNCILAWPLARAKKALKLFPGVGDPGAEKILMFCGAYSGLALESNGLRVLTRAGFGREQKSYVATYRSVQEALQGNLPGEAAALSRAHLVLRKHGQETCRRAGPECGGCPVASLCALAVAGKKDVVSRW